MDFIESVKRLRSEHPELGLVGAKRMMDKHGSYEKAKAACTEGRIEPETAIRMESADLRRALNAIYREAHARDLMPSDIEEIAQLHNVQLMK